MTDRPNAPDSRGSNAGPRVVDGDAPDSRASQSDAQAPDSPASNTSAPARDSHTSSAPREAPASPASNIAAPARDSRASNAQREALDSPASNTGAPARDSRASNAPREAPDSPASNIAASARDSRASSDPREAPDSRVLTAGAGDANTPRSRWPTIRASLILFAIVVGAIDGCPLPPEQYVTSAQRPFVDALRPAQQTVLAPFKWITQGLRFSQRWALMQAAPRERLRFIVEGRTANPIDARGGARADTWIVLYRANDPDHTAFANVLETHHVWGVWNPTDRMMGQYSAFVRWFTGYVLAQRPELAAVRTKYEKVIIEDGDVRATGEVTSVMTRERGAR